MSQFTYNPANSKEGFLRLENYQHGNLIHMKDGVDWRGTGLGELSRAVETGANPGNPVFKLKLTGGLTSSMTLKVQNQLGKIMDWTPDYRLTDPRQWKFAEPNLRNLCVRKDCQK